jgi:hypothetical protein
VVLSGRMGPRGLAAFACGEPAALGEDFADFLRAQRQNAARASDDRAFPSRLTTYRAPDQVHQNARLPLAGMADIAPVRFRFTVSMRGRASGFHARKSGNTQPRAVTTGAIRGATSGRADCATRG